MQTRMFHVNYLVAQRRGTSNLRVTSTSVADMGNGNNGNNQNNQNNANNANNNGNNNGGNNGNGSGLVQMERTDVNTTSLNDFWADVKAAVEASKAKTAA